MIFSREEPDTIQNGDTTSYVKVDEIWNEENSSFDKTNFQTLLNYITGEDNTQLEKINELASRSQGWTAADMRETNIGEKAAGQDIKVIMGGLEWEVCYLSQTKSGDPILTLWLSNSTQEAWQDGSGGNRSDLSETQGEHFGFKNGNLNSKWQYTSEYDIYDGFPPNMYGKSYIRVVTLNNGGLCTSSTMETPDPIQQDEKSVFAKFTMPSVAGNLTDFIVKPEQVAWQEKQLGTEYGWKYNLANESWSKDIPDDGFYKWSYDTLLLGKHEFVNNYAKLDSYGSNAWKDDYIWLPSTTEVGSKVERFAGIWNLSVEQCANSITNINGASWLRSGADFVDTSKGEMAGGPKLFVNSMHDKGNMADFLLWPDYALSVRPALHLNLKKAYQTLPEPTSWSEKPADKFDNETGNHLADTSLGTQNNPYKIATAEQLALLAKDVNNGNSFAGKYFIQTADIRLDGYEWTPIGIFNPHNYPAQDESIPFSGHFNGSGYKIDGITINNTDDHLASLGLFGYLSGNGVVENVNLNSGEVASVNYYETDCYMGLIGYATDEAEIVNCTNRANFKGADHAVGGIVGGAHESPTIQNCTNYGNIKTGGTTRVYTGAGGIVGSLLGLSFIENCFNYGDIEGAVAGGLVGQIGDGSSMQNSISNATVSGAFVGGLVGFALNSSETLLQNCAAFGVLKYVEFENWYTPDTLGALIGVADDQYYGVEGCSFQGTTLGEKDFKRFWGFSSAINESYAVFLTCCYVWVNQEGFYSRESLNWSEYFTVLDVPKQKSLYWAAAAVDQTNEEIIAEMKVLGFKEYIQPSFQDEEFS